MRLIDADALLDTLGAKNDCDECNFSFGGAFCSRPEVFTLICKEITDAPTIDTALQWIPVTDRLPENDDSVLACYYNGECQACAVAWHDGEKWQCWDDRIGICDDVIAWMPLPAPYDSLQGAMNPPEDVIKTSMALLNSIADNAVRVATILQDMNEELKRAKK